MRKIRTFSNDEGLVLQRRNHIIKIATGLIARKGYNHVNTRELATALGMSTGGLYHYIGSKEDILYLIINFTSDLTTQSLEQIAELNKDASPVDALILSLLVFLQTVENYRDFHNFLNHVMLSLSANDRKIVYQAESRVVDHFETVLQAGAEKGIFQVHNTKLVAHNIVSIAHSWANRGWYLKRYYSLDQYAREESALLLRQVTTMPNKSIDSTISRCIKRGIFPNDSSTNGF